VSLQPIGRAHRLVSSMADVTERRQAEEQLRIERERLALALQAAQMGVYDFDLRSEVLWWSPQTYKIFGVDPHTFKPSAQSVTARIHPNDLERFLHDRSQAIAQHRALFIEFRIVRPDGLVAWLGHRGQTQYDAHGTAVRHYGVAMDITERKHAEQSLIDADRQKDSFIATLAHELRNPLAPIRNAVELLRRKGGADPQVARCQEIIDRQVGQMSHLLDDLLDLSRLTYGKFQLRKELLAVATVVERAVEIAHPLIESSGHSLTVELPTMPLYLEGDLTRLAQVFSNLLINAAKYTPNKGLILLRAWSENDRLVASVRDNGIGIAAEQMPRIFEMFEQAPSALNRSQGGLGIGLSISRRLIEMHGGQISAHSEGAGKGSEFRVRLALANVEGRSIAAPRPHGLPNAAVVNALRILVADDLVDIAEILAMVFESMGHQVSVAHDGEAALELGSTFLPDVVFLDLGMPRMDGFETCRRIRQTPWGKHVTMIAQTGWGHEEDRQRSLDAGFDHHIVKPIDPGELAALLSTIGARRAGAQRS
jgi:PAS domain S-box-containing protein